MNVYECVCESAYSVKECDRDGQFALVKSKKSTFIPKTRKLKQQEKLKNNLLKVKKNFK